MRSMGSSGVWELFLPGVGNGDVYKFEIKTPSGEIYLKSDPYAFYAEVRPNTASRVYDLDGYRWNDEPWLRDRRTANLFERPVSIYEVHLGSWATIPATEEEDGIRPLTYREHADRLVKYVKEMAYTHIELLPVSEYPYDGSWGYQVTGYYAATSRYGEPHDFMYLVDKCHENGIGVILDWVPAHFPKDGHGLARFDGTACYEHMDPKKGEHLEWGTHIFNYGRNEVRNFLVSNAVFWFDKYHIDGLRVDAVASMLYLDYNRENGEWVPNQYGGRENLEAVEFLRQLNGTVYHYFPGAMMIAEESTSWPLVTKPPYVGGLGFTFKWNMGWMNDFLRFTGMDPIYRKYNMNLLTFASVYATAENYILVLSHDEVVHGKRSLLNKQPGEYEQKFAGLRASFGFMYAFMGKKLTFMGSEFGQFIEWNYKKELDWHLLDYDMHRKMQTYVKELNWLYRSSKALYEQDYGYDGFQWIDCNDAEHSVISFIRKGKDWHDMLLFVINFTPVAHSSYRIGAPFNLHYTEVFNSDAEYFGGTNMGNDGGVVAQTIPFHNMEYSLDLVVPAYGVIVLRPDFH